MVHASAHTRAHVACAEDDRLALGHASRGQHRRDDHFAVPRAPLPHHGVLRALEGARVDRARVPHAVAEVHPGRTQGGGANPAPLR